MLNREKNQYKFETPEILPLLVNITTWWVHHLLEVRVEVNGTINWANGLNVGCDGLDLWLRCYMWSLVEFTTRITNTVAL